MNGRIAIALTAVIITSGSAVARCPVGADPLHFVSGGDLCLAMRAFGTEMARPGGPLVVFLHGDGWGRRDARAARSLFDEARSMAGRGVVSVALIRPGYDDGENHGSGGSHHGRFDHYTEQNNRAVAAAVRELRLRYRAGRVVIVGHSGGAATAAVVIARDPGVADGAVLVACPCNLQRWSAGRWRFVRSDSPSDFVERVPRSTRVVAVTGSLDTDTAPALASEYVSALAARGVEASFHEIPGADHRFRGLRRYAFQAALNLLR